MFSYRDRVSARIAPGFPVELPAGAFLATGRRLLDFGDWRRDCLGLGYVWLRRHRLFRFLHHGSASLSHRFDGAAAASTGSAAVSTGSATASAVEVTSAGSATTSAGSTSCFGGLQFLDGYQVWGEGQFPGSLVNNGEFGNQFGCEWLDSRQL